MTYYDEQFKPFEIVDGQCVVADESEWEKLVKINGQSEMLSLTNGDRLRPTVKVPTDIFEDFSGSVVTSSGVRIHESKFCWANGPYAKPPPYHVWVNDLFTRFFRAIDATQHVDYLIVTQHPELVRDKLPVRTGEHPCIKGIDCNRHDDFSRPNIILAVPVETQADLERLVPELLKCHDLCKGLAVVCNPRERLHVEPYLTRSYEPTQDYAELQGIDLIIAEGNEHPIHPQWLRSLRDQCKDVVPFNFAGWGEWAPRTTHKESLTGQDQHTAFIDGMPGDKFPEDYRMVKWGHERSGRLLDGQEHNGRLT